MESDHRNRLRDSGRNGVAKEEKRRSSPAAATRGRVGAARVVSHHFREGGRERESPTRPQSVNENLKSGFHFRNGKSERGRIARDDVHDSGTLVKAEDREERSKVIEISSPRDPSRLLGALGELSSFLSPQVREQIGPRPVTAPRPELSTKQYSASLNRRSLSPARGHDPAPARSRDWEYAGRGTVPRSRSPLWFSESASERSRRTDGASYEQRHSQSASRRATWSHDRIGQEVIELTAKLEELERQLAEEKREKRAAKRALLLSKQNVSELEEELARRREQDKTRRAEGTWYVEEIEELQEEKEDLREQNEALAVQNETLRAELARLRWELQSQAAVTSSDARPRPPPPQQQNATADRTLLSSSSAREASDAQGRSHRASDQIEDGDGGRRRAEEHQGRSAPTRDDDDEDNDDGEDDDDDVEDGGGERASREGEGARAAHPRGGAQRRGKGSRERGTAQSSQSPRGVVEGWEELEESDAAFARLVASIQQQNLARFRGTWRR